MFNQDARNTLFAGAADDSKLISNFHLKYTTIAETHGSKIVHHFVRKFNGNLRVITSIGCGCIYFSAVSDRRPRIDMKTNKGLSALTHASLNTIEEIIA